MHHFSSVAERNKQPILTQLRNWLANDETILEIGSGSGQHALFFSQHFPAIHWQCSEREEDTVRMLIGNIVQENLINVLTPIVLDVVNYDWGAQPYDAIFTANTLHIMTEQEVAYFLNHVHLALKPHGKLIIYGPFIYQNKYTSDSNRKFDKMLRQRNVGSGLKSFDLIAKVLHEYQFTLKHDIPMPANNQLLYWELMESR